MSKKFYLICIALCAFLCITIYVSQTPFDRLNHTFFQADLYENSLDNETTYRTFPLQLPAGAYTYTVNYKSADPIPYQIKAPERLGSNNDFFLVTDAEEFLPAAGSTTSEERTFYISEKTSGLILEFIAKGDHTFSSLALQSGGRVYNDAITSALLVFGLFLIFMALAFLNEKQKSNPTTLAQVSYSPGPHEAFFIFVFIAFVTTMPLMKPYLTNGHDANFHLSRIEGIADGLRSGQFPVIISSSRTLGYGDLSPIFYPSLFLYIPAILLLLGHSLLFSYSVFVFSVNLLTAYIAYVSIKGITRSKAAGYAGSLLYTFALYRLVNLYTRAALGELTAMAFLPLVVYGMYEVLFGEEKKLMPLVLGYTGLLHSHVLSVEIMAFFCLLFLIFSLKSLTWRRFFALGKAALLTVFLNAFFLTPFLYYYFSVDIIAFFRAPQPYAHMTFLPQMFTSFVSTFGNSKDIFNLQGEMPLSIGFLLACVLLSYAFVAYRDMKKGTAASNRMGSLCFGFAIFFLYLSNALFPWIRFDQSERTLFHRLILIIQFPWRFYGVATVCICILGGLLFDRLPQKHTAYLLFALFLLSALNVSPYLADYTSNPSQSKAIPMKFASFEQHFVSSGKYISSNKYLALDTNEKDLLSRGISLKASSKDVEITNTDRDGMNFTFTYHKKGWMGQSAFIEMPMHYFDGYVACLDDQQPLFVTQGKGNLVNIALPEGTQEGTVHIRYRHPSLFMAGYVVSALTIVGLLLLKIRNRKAHTKKK